MARSIRYYNQINEIHIYIVEVKSKDYGNADTNMLLKAISVGLQYRFMFLDQNSPFSAKAFRFEPLPDLRQRVSELIQELDHLLWVSEDAGLRNAESLRLIYDGTNEDTDNIIERWETEKAALYASAWKVLGATDNDLAQAKKELVSVVEAFCKATIDMNAQYTSRVLLLLNDIVARGRSTVQSRITPPSALPASAHRRE